MPLNTDGEGGVIFQMTSITLLSTVVLLRQKHLQPGQCLDHEGVHSVNIGVDQLLKQAPLLEANVVAEANICSWVSSPRAAVVIFTAGERGNERPPANIHFLKTSA